MRQIPFALTLIRILSSPVLVWLLITDRFREALALTLVAGVTDWFDGFAARKLGVSGPVGTILDPLADKFMLVTLFFALAWVRLLPLWMLLIVMGRDVVIVTGAILLRIFRGYRRFLPSLIGKVSTFFQIVLVLLVLTNAAYPSRFLYWLTELALALSALFTMLSWADYVRRGIQMTRRRYTPAAS